MSEPIFISHYEKKIVDINDFPVGNPIVINTIQLLLLSRKLDNPGPGIKLRPDELDAVHLKPSLFQPVDNGDLDQISKYLTRDSVRKLLKRSIILIVTHCGFHETSDAIIEMLTEITEEYLNKFASALRLIADTSCFRGENDFIDMMSRVMIEMGSDLAVIQHFDANLRSYRNNILKEVIRKIQLLKNQPLD